MTAVVSVLPREIEERIADFLVAGKTGSVELHINGGSIESWKIIESGRVRR
jgi:hypothetical protein